MIQAIHDYTLGVSQLDFSLTKICLVIVWKQAERQGNMRELAGYCNDVE